MLTPQNTELDKYTPDWTETFLTNYDQLISDAAELATNWAELENEEQIHHRSIAMQTWGMRSTLGMLYRAGHLPADQVARLADLDQKLLETAADIEICYGPALSELIKNLLSWGTPLTELTGAVRLQVSFELLPTLAQALAVEHHLTA